MKTKSTKSALVLSALTLLVCVAMIAGTTYAWFTDSITTGRNQIVAGTLKVDVQYSADMADWQTVTDETTVFDGNAVWEPGAAQVAYFKVANAGDLVVKYQLGTNVLNNVRGENAAGEVIDLTKYLKFGIVPVETAFADRAAALNAVKDTAVDFGTLAVGGDKIAVGTSVTFAMIVFMPAAVSNEANYAADKVPYVEFGVSVVATQATGETDGFGDNYDANAQYPEVEYDGVIAPTPADEFEAALNAAENGDTIVVNGTVALDKSLTINKNLTVKAGPAGATFTGTPLYIGKNANVTLSGLTFVNPTNAVDNASAVYAPGFAGKLVVENCTFKNCKWEGVQVTPVDGASITVTGCTFTAETGWEAHRYLHIQATQNANCTAEVAITNNTFGSTEFVNESIIDVDYLDYVNNLTVGGNTFAKIDIDKGDIYVCDTAGAEWDYQAAYEAFIA